MVLDPGPFQGQGTGEGGMETTPLPITRGCDMGVGAVTSPWPFLKQRARGRVLTTRARVKQTVMNLGLSRRPWGACNEGLLTFPPWNGKGKC